MTLWVRKGLDDVILNAFIGLSAWFHTIRPYYRESVLQHRYPRTWQRQSWCYKYIQDTWQKSGLCGNLTGYFQRNSSNASSIHIHSASNKLARMDCFTA